jgi:hypothetical protein
LKLASIHADLVLVRFRWGLEAFGAAQERAMRRALRQLSGSLFFNHYGLRGVRTRSDLRRAMPILRYEDMRPWIERVMAGEFGALFAPGVAPVMFAVSSGTTSRCKYIPVTPAFVTDYRAGWNTFGMRMLRDHLGAARRSILQVVGRYDASQAPCGLPCGAITGLMARSQKAVIRRMYVGSPEVANLADSRARAYALMRLGVVRDVGFAVTANPATLIRMAQIADELRETLIRDVHDGTMSAEVVGNGETAASVRSGLRPNPERAGELEKLVEAYGVLRPRDYWRPQFLACWTGGSMGHYLQRLADWWGETPVRDIGLLASEGRVSIPLADGTAAGVLAYRWNSFEFIPIEEGDREFPATLLGEELTVGREYIVVMSNTAGLVRYRLDDVVRCEGFVGRTPVVEFLYRGGGVSNVAGEKLTEYHAVSAVRAACAALGVPDCDFLLAPLWGDPARYRINVFQPAPDELAGEVDRALCRCNEEYESRRESGRLGALVLRQLDRSKLTQMDERLIAARGATGEQYKRPCLLTRLDSDNEVLRLDATESARPAARSLEEVGLRRANHSG